MFGKSLLLTLSVILFEDIFFGYFYCGYNLILETSFLVTAFFLLTLARSQQLLLGGWSVADNSKINFIDHNKTLMNHKSLKWYKRGI